MIDDDELRFHPPRELELLLPGLLGPWPHLPSSALPNAPYLSRLLQWANPLPSPTMVTNDLDDRLCQRFSLTTTEGSDRPIGAITAKADAQRQPETGAWLRADPVYLRADARALTLIDCQQNPVRGAEMDALADTFNAHFAQDGLHWEPTLPGRGVLRVTGTALDRLADLQTTPIWQVNGRDIQHFLPKGAAGRQWNRWLTETQLLFHDHPVNQHRTEAGKAPINSLWFWGSGPLPPQVNAPAIGLYGETVVMHGLCRLAEVEHSPVPEDAESWFEQSLEEPTGLLAATDFWIPWQQGDWATWAATVTAWDERYFALLYHLWRRGKLTQLVIDPLNQVRYQLRSTEQPRWWQKWRRSKPFARWLNQPVGGKNAI